MVIDKEKNILKELHALVGSSDSLYDGQVFFLLGDDEDDGKADNDAFHKETKVRKKLDDYYLDIYFFVTPKGGLYKNARIKFHMRVNVHHYPAVSPVVTCMHSIYHPNIGMTMTRGGAAAQSEAAVCVKSDWELGAGLEGAVLAVLYLLYNPRLDDPMGPAFLGCRLEYDTFVSNVCRSLRGEHIINGYRFDTLLDDRCNNNNNSFNYDNRSEEILECERYADKMDFAYHCSTSVKDNVEVEGKHIAGVESKGTTTIKQSSFPAAGVEAAAMSTYKTITNTQNNAHASEEDGSNSTLTFLGAMQSQSTNDYPPRVLRSSIAGKKIKDIRTRRAERRMATIRRSVGVVSRTLGTKNRRLAFVPR